jgi:hypothetical protein
MLPDKDSKSVLSQNWTADVLQGIGQLYTVYPSVIKHSVTYKKKTVTDQCKVMLIQQVICEL